MSESRPTTQELSPTAKRFVDFVDQRAGKGANEEALTFERKASYSIQPGTLDIPANSMTVTSQQADVLEGLCRDDTIEFFFRETPLIGITHQILTPGESEEVKEPYHGEFGLVVNGVPVDNHPGEQPPPDKASVEMLLDRIQWAEQAGQIAPVD